MYRFFLLLPVALTLFLIPTIHESFAETEYVTSHFHSKGTLTSIVNSQPAVVWTMIDGDKGTIVSSYEAVNSITRLDIQPHPECPQHKDIACMEGVITEVKNSKISKVGDRIVMKYEIPYSQTITFFDGGFAGTTFVVDLSKFDARDASRIIKQQTDKEITDELQKESYLRIVDGRHLLRNSIVQDQLMGSYLIFANLGDGASFEIEKRNQEWVDAKPGISPLEDAIINNKVSDLLREEMKKDSNRPVKFVIKEIILTDT